MKFNNIANFSIFNPHIATFVYNSHNGLFKTLQDIIADSSNFNQSQAQIGSLIFYLFLGILFLLIIFQAPIGYWMNSIINKEAELFLLVPRGEYLKMVKSTNAFLILIKVLIFN